MVCIMIKPIISFTLFIFLLTSYNQVWSQQSKLNTIEAQKDIGSTINEYSTNPEGWPALHYAIKMKDVRVAEILIDLYPEQITQRTPSTDIWNTYESENPDYEFDYIWETHPGFSAIELAVKSQLKEIVALLLSNGADPNISRTERLDIRWDKGKQFICFFGCKNSGIQMYKPIYWAIIQKDPEILELLCNYNASLREPYVFRFVAILGDRACIRKIIYCQMKRMPIPVSMDEELIDDSIIDLFLEYELNNLGLPALHYALLNNNPEIFSLLLDYGADPIINTGCSQSLFEKAYNNPDPAFYHALHERGYTHLFEIIKQQNVEALKELIASGLDLSENSEALLLSINGASREIFETILKLNKPNKDAYIACIAKNKIEYLKMMVDLYGVDEGLLKDLKKSALKDQRKEILEYLLQLKPINPQ